MFLVLYHQRWAAVTNCLMSGRASPIFAQKSYLDKNINFGYVGYDRNTPLQQKCEIGGNIGYTNSVNLIVSVFRLTLGEKCKIIVYD